MALPRECGPFSFTVVLYLILSCQTTYSKVYLRAVILSHHDEVSPSIMS